HKEVPRMLERSADRGQALRVLHLAIIGIGIPSYAAQQGSRVFRARIQCAPPSRSSVYVPAAIRNAAGMVRIHAQMICVATPQRTADNRRVAPTPTIDPVIAWVVLTGTPVCVAMRIEIAAPVSAANPPTGMSFVIFDPVV